jgi:hypothetical protein
MNVQTLALLFVLTGSAALAAEASLQVSGVAGRDGVTRPAVTFNAAALAALPRTKARVHENNGGDRTYEGVLLCDILKRAGQPFGQELRGSLLTRFVMVTAHDGYRALFSLPELDPAFSNNGALVADTVDGRPLDAKQGPLTIVVPAEKQHARWVYGVERIEVMGAPEPVR